jgi:hypothetical protein
MQYREPNPYGRTPMSQSATSVQFSNTVLAKKRKEGMAQWKPRKKYKKLRIEGTIGYQRLEVINY